MTTKRMRGGNGVEESMPDVNEPVVPRETVVKANTADGKNAKTLGEKAKNLGENAKTLDENAKTLGENANNLVEKAKNLGETARNATLNVIQGLKNWLGIGGRHHKTRKNRSKSRKNRKY
jgi:hypothetical protein